LWKIVELSDVIVQVVDARDPLFFESSDLSIYVKEVDSRKESVLLLNKADLLTEEQRKTWSKHFLESDTKALFFSATIEEESDGDLNLQEETEIEFGSSQILRPDQVLSVMKNTMQAAETVTVGFTGYPNVGKSSTINRFLTTKKLQVSATPGKTKHFQVIFCYSLSHSSYNSFLYKPTYLV
jgi:large subunit GTPase 1